MQLKYLFCVNRCVIFSSQCVQRKGKRRSLRSSQKFLQKILCSKWVNTAALRHHVLFKSRRPANIHVHAHHHYYRWTAMRRGFIAAAVFDRHAHNIDICVELPAVVMGDLKISRSTRRRANVYWLSRLTELCRD